MSCWTASRSTRKEQHPDAAEGEDRGLGNDIVDYRQLRTIRLGGLAAAEAQRRGRPCFISTNDPAEVRRWICYPILHVIHQAGSGPRIGLEGRANAGCRTRLGIEVAARR